jgi:alkanesulfonate monooxygenase SsuD/methylene tetrahydromethanopterin reductase-like flavin-dependent oxidoreductase (luciferase family)
VRRVGRFADAFLPTWTPVAGYRDAQAAITRHAEEAGRNADAIRWGGQLWTCVGDSTEAGRHVGTCSLQERFGIDHVDYEGSIAMGSAADCIEIIERYAALGVTAFNLSAVCPPSAVAEQYGRIAEEVLPHFARV